MSDHLTKYFPQNIAEKLTKSFYYEQEKWLSPASCFYGYSTLQLDIRKRIREGETGVEFPLREDWEIVAIQIRDQILYEYIAQNPKDISKLPLNIFTAVIEKSETAKHGDMDIDPECIYEACSSILAAIQGEQNILISGPGGTGKTLCLKYICNYMADNDIPYGLCGSTGVAALNVGGQTLHSWGGIPVADISKELMYYRVIKRKEVVERWEKSKYLVIDEISMIGAKLFELVNYIAQRIRNNREPFGGLKLIVCGDFLQLPPVKDEWIFSSPSWASCKFKRFEFNSSVRFADREYFAFLSRIRYGCPTPEDIKMLRKRVVAYCQYIEEKEEKQDTEEWKKTVQPTQLFSRKVDVLAMNMQELEKLDGKEYIFRAQDIHFPKTKHYSSEKADLMLEEAIPNTVLLKVGAQVMLRCNLSTSEGFINGSRGVVLELNPAFAVVKFTNNCVRIITAYDFKYETQDGHSIRSQLPLILGYCLTIHKTQGLTIDKCILDIGPSIFNPGQAYVALSRCRNIQNVLISDFVSKSIVADKKALDFSQHFPIEEYIEISFDSSPPKDEEETPVAAIDQK